ncbi:unnamed protein product [Rotaria sordida]|uniref:PiggyBac transposable element-derived protein domain-containing protein n=1 Tax=Rotaria sordida TaxID=392033 RepID=A0A815F830_9BILA|nr:unnamed protein product [Rotaria sordida]CAF1586674.1 unnamed protein product [Rotaria sordida]
MSYNEEDIFEQDDEIDQYTKALDDSDIDDIEDDMKPVGNIESEEYSDDENRYPSKVTITAAGCTKKEFEEKWTFVVPENDCRSKCLSDFNEPPGPTFTVPITCNEIKKIFAICIHMEMIRKRRILDYWSTDPLLSTPIFHSKNYLSRNRFFEILRFLRFADYEKMVDSDRLRKIRLFLEIVREISTCVRNSDENIVAFDLGVPKELTRKKMKAPDSAFIRSGELLLVKFLDKKASGEKEIYLIDSKGIAGGSLVERYEKGNVISIPLE